MVSPGCTKSARMESKMNQSQFVQKDVCCGSTRATELSADVARMTADRAWRGRPRTAGSADVRAPDADFGFFNNSPRDPAHWIRTAILCMGMALV